MTDTSDEQQRAARGERPLQRCNGYYHRNKPRLGCKVLGLFQGVAMANALRLAATLLNILLALVLGRLLFLETHWDDPEYVFVVVLAFGTPVLNLLSLWLRRTL